MFERIVKHSVFLGLLILVVSRSLLFADPVDLDAGVDNDIRPLKGPVEIKEGFPVGFFILLILLFIVAILVVPYFRKKRHIEERSLAPPRPPEEIAIEELRALLEMKLVEQGLVKEFYIRLSDVIRKFLEGRFRIFALDRTTWELYHQMRAKRFDRVHAERIRDFLEDCDLVKFAKYIPIKKEIEEAYNRAKEIVEITTPKEINPNYSK